MDLAYLDRQAKDNNGVKYLLVRQEMFDNRRRKGNEDRRLEGKIQDIIKIVSQKNRPKKSWVDQGTEFA